MKQEYTLILIIGLLLTAYVLEAAVKPLTLILPTPYHYASVNVIRNYPFSATIIIIRAISVFMGIVWLLSFIEKAYAPKAIFSLVIAALAQLYALQELATGANMLSLEWSLSISLAGTALFPMVAIYLLKNILSSAHKKLANPSDETRG